jgi:hypothetical protein
MDTAVMPSAFIPGSSAVDRQKSNAWLTLFLEQQQPCRI